VVVCDDETANDDVVARDEETANDDVIANDDVVARDEETAKLAVPNVEPVRMPRNDPVKEPVKGRVNELNWRELETVPAGTVAVAFSA
jgi:hypothetical protein